MEIHTLLELLDKVVDHLLQHGRVNREDLLELLDLLLEILRQIRHGSYTIISLCPVSIPAIQLSSCQLRGDNSPLRDGGSLGPIPTMIESQQQTNLESNQAVLESNQTTTTTKETRQWIREDEEEKVQTGCEKNVDFAWGSKKAPQPLKSYTGHAYRD